MKIKTADEFRCRILIFKLSVGVNNIELITENQTA